MRKLGLFDIERGKICEKLNEAGIWYLPLKGIVIKDFYPEFGMREMSDNDILCDASKMAQVREIMEAFGYECEEYRLTNHDNYKKLPTLEFEMHRLLFEKDAVPEFDAYYENIIEKAVCKESCEYALTDEDFYIYQLVHSIKHLYDSGVGLRALTDIYVFLNKFTARREYIDRELKALGIDREERVMASLAHKLFSPEKPLDELSFTPEEENILAIILQSGANGTLSQSIKNQASRDIFAENTEITGKNKRAYIRSRLFPKPEAYEISHPFFYKHKAFRPLLVFVRIGESLFRKKGELTRELKMLSRVSDKNRKL